MEIGGHSVARGERTTVMLELPRLYTRGDFEMPVMVVRGKKEGPTLLVTAAIHGDEIAGVEVVHRLLDRKALQQLRGTLLAVPVVNVYGLVQRMRYLPDRRDLNRAFPGSEKGSLTARLANLVMEKLVAHADYVVDLHTAAVNRSNLPQIRADLTQEALAPLAMAFGAPVVLDTGAPQGSLRFACAKANKPCLLYEAGEALRFDEWSARVGQRGIVHLMREIGMLKPAKKKPGRPPFLAKGSRWIRAPVSGVFHAKKHLGHRVAEGETVGYLTDPLGHEHTPLLSSTAGMVIGETRLPLAHQGDALLHIAYFERPATLPDRLGIDFDFEEEAPRAEAEPAD